MATTWPLTGRAEELSLISGLTRRRDGPAGVVLAGAAGVGKTRLAREALAAAGRADPVGGGHGLGAGAAARRFRHYAECDRAGSGPAGAPGH